MGTYQGQSIASIIACVGKVKNKIIEAVTDITLTCCVTCGKKLNMKSDAVSHLIGTL